MMCMTSAVSEGIEKGAPNFVKRLYEPFTYEQVSDMIATITRPEGLKSEYELVYQTVTTCIRHALSIAAIGTSPAITRQKGAIGL